MNSIVVELFGRKIPIKTQDSEDHIRELVKYIESKLEEIDPEGRLPEMTLSILALLNLSDDLFKEQQRLREMRNKVRSKSTFLLDKMQESRYLC
jgi:cell division protein ZapA (FtsZ GTPase activity inhibitor)